MIAGWIERIAGRYLPASQGPSIDEIVATLNPRFVLTFSVATPPSLPPGSDQFNVDAPDGSGKPRLSVDAYFSLKTHMTTAVSSDFRAGYFDLAVIGANYRLGERRRILRGLQSTAYRNSVVLLMRRPTANPRRSLADARRGIEADLSGLVFAGIVGPEPGLLIGDLDQAHDASASRASIRQSVGSFVASRRITALPISSAPTIAADAPRRSGDAVQPRCRTLRDDEARLLRVTKGNKRTIGQWWRKPLRLIDAAVTCTREAGYVPADGANRALLIDPIGHPLAISYRMERGYSLDPAAMMVDMPASCVIAPDGARHPPQAARMMLTGQHEPGDFFLLGRFDPRFGHFLIESLSVGWAVEWALARGMRFLLWGALKPYHASAIELLGIPLERIVHAVPGTTYERLYSAEPAFRMLGSVSPVVGDGWNRIAAAAMAEAGEPVSEPFVYLSRAGIANRPLTNEVELERMLARRGGRIVRPETLPFVEQVRLVRQSRAIVGCFGSQLHLSMFQAPGRRKLVIGTEQFTGPDETLISMGNGTLADHYVEPTSRRAGTGARFNAWTLDLQRFEPALDAWLASDEQGPAFTPLASG